MRNYLYSSSPFFLPPTSYLHSSAASDWLMVLESALSRSLLALLYHDTTFVTCVSRGLMESLKRWNAGGVAMVITLMKVRWGSLLRTCLALFILLLLLLVSRRLIIVRELDSCDEEYEEYERRERKWFKGNAKWSLKEENILQTKPLNNCNNRK